MAIHVKTSDSKALLSDIYRAIDRGQVRTWQYDREGDFTHATEQWRNKAWLRPRRLAGELLLTILPPVNTNLSAEIYAIYHGRFVEALLAHFDRRFSEVIASAMPESGDRVG